MEFLNYPQMEEICENESFEALIEDYNEELHGDWDDYEYLS